MVNIPNIGQQTWLAIVCAGCMGVLSCGRSVHTTTPVTSAPGTHATSDANSQTGGTTGNSGSGSSPGDANAHNTVVTPRRVLIIGPSDQAQTMAHDLASMVHEGVDPNVAIDALSTATPDVYPPSLMYFFYDPNNTGADSPTGRLTRLSQIQNYSHVILLDDEDWANEYPEFYYEGVRQVADYARSLAVQPIVMARWPVVSSHSNGELAYRVGNGTATFVIPAAYVDVPTIPSSARSTYQPYIEAAAAYHTLWGQRAENLTFWPNNLDPNLHGSTAVAVDQAMDTQATAVHYSSPFSGVVRVAVAPLPATGDFNFLCYGTSTEERVHDQLNALRVQAGLAGSVADISDSARVIDSNTFVTYPQTVRYDGVLARAYDTTQAFLQQQLQSQVIAFVYDKHAASGVVGDLGWDEVASFSGETTTGYQRDTAAAFGLTLIPFHVGWARLKIADPNTVLLVDGTHLDDGPNLLFASMIYVSLTGKSPVLGSSDMADAAHVGEAVIRELASLSKTGAFVADDPNTRPRLY